MMKQIVLMMTAKLMKTRIFADLEASMGEGFLLSSTRRRDGAV
jgi:hypothetical protein